MTQEYNETLKAFLDHFNENVEETKRWGAGEKLCSGSYLVNASKYHTLSEDERDMLKKEIAAMTSWPDKTIVTIKKSGPYEDRYNVLIEYNFK